jgi:mRNA interferase RelE/StbE
MHRVAPIPSPRVLHEGGTAAAAGMVSVPLFFDGGLDLESVWQELARGSNHHSSSVLTLEKPRQRRISAKIDSLKTNPRPSGVEKLSGEEDLYRVRVGDYRILYQIHDRILLVLILRIGHRQDVYRLLSR